MNFLVVVQMDLSFGTIFTISWIFFSILLALALNKWSNRLIKNKQKRAYPNEELDTSEQLDKALHFVLKQKQAPLSFP